jgi:hypothetical protein
VLSAPDFWPIFIPRFILLLTNQPRVNKIGNLALQAAAASNKLLLRAREERNALNLEPAG